jgi:hypothetical protein
MKYRRFPVVGTGGARSSVIKLLEISLQQTLQSLAVTSLVTSLL